ncbi:MAG TPA: AIR synthase family protein [Anaerolineales bacterium]|nr:AIR synthase family protein [Anaerolineales bacterium]
MLPLGKLPPELLKSLLPQTSADPQVVLGPGIGMDCAIVDVGDKLLALKSDPITFAVESIGWYAVQVNANDIATTGARPRWFLSTILLPEAKATRELVEHITGDIFQACQDLGITVVGGHTEITYGLDRPLVIGTLIGEVTRERLVTPKGIQPGDRILLTKGVPIEGTAILAREFVEQLGLHLSGEDIHRAQNFLYEPGISIVRDAQVACEAGSVTGMHDPTEGGLAAALWEMAIASGLSLVVEPEAVPCSELSRRVCQVFDLDPLATIASGALLLTVPPEDVTPVCAALHREGILCAQIGRVETGPPQVWQMGENTRQLFPYPERDEITRVYERQI